MAIQQIAFDIPADIGASLARGVLVQHGGVIRDQTGKIVTFLTEAAETGQGRPAARALAQASKGHPVVAATVGVGVVAAGAATTLAARRRHAALQDALQAYLEALSNADLDTATVDRLLAELETAAGAGRPVRPWGWGHAKVRSLLTSVQDYTRRLAHANNTPGSEVVLPLESGPECSILDLRPYLKAQREILTLPA